MLEPLRLCRYDEIEDPGSRGFHFGDPYRGAKFFIVRRDKEIWGYENSCPHTGAPMDWQPGQVLSLDKSLIQCALHFAQFRFEDGLCLHGPCRGQNLVPVAIERRGDEIWLTDAVMLERAAN